VVLLLIQLLHPHDEKRSAPPLPQGSPNLFLLDSVHSSPKPYSGFEPSDWDNSEVILFRLPLAVEMKPASTPEFSSPEFWHDRHKHQGFSQRHWL
jgi:hypothetical protein